MRRAFGLVRWIFLVAAAVGGARLDAQVRERPGLPAGADTKDWEAYYDLGVQLLQRDAAAADAAFYWAARLDPTRAEPGYARWVAFWLAQPQARYRAYASGDDKVRRAPDVVRADSLRALAFRRNPFVHQGLFLAIVDAMPGYYPRDEATQGWLAYASADLPNALSRFARAIRDRPDRFGNLRFIRAAAFVGMSRYDSALVQVDEYLRLLRARDATSVVGFYESKATLEHAQGLLLEQLRRPEAADEAFGRALVEDLSFTPAHLAVGRRALARGDSAQAVRELRLALELDSTDVVTRLALGDALLRGGNAEAATEQYRRAAELEPNYAEAFYRYGLGLERGGWGDEAAAAYTRAIALGARTWPNARNAQARLAALKAPG